MVAIEAYHQRLNPSMFSVEYMEQEAIEFLREHEPSEGYFVGFSGGKDSITTEYLCRLAGVKYQAFYSCTGIDAPEVVRFIKGHYPHVTFLYPEMTFWEGIRKRTPPLRMRRWCCDVLKKDPSKHIPLKHKVMGIRAEESFRRASRPRVDIIGKRVIKEIIHKPIFQWAEWHVWEFIDKHNLPYPCLYDEGFSRIGCVICPFILGKNQTRLNIHKERWPQIYKVFERVVYDWHRSHSTKPEVHRDETAEEYLEAYYRGFE